MPETPARVPDEVETALGANVDHVIDNVIARLRHCADTLERIKAQGPGPNRRDGLPDWAWVAHDVVNEVGQNGVGALLPSVVTAAAEVDRYVREPDRA